jgi:hypothetical protein
VPTLTGTYYRGRLKLDKPVKVTVYYEEEGKEGLKLSDFSSSCPRSEMTDTLDIIVKT